MEPYKDNEKRLECPEHSGRYMEFFCGSHTQLCCYICKSNEHSKCKDVKSVKELSGNVSGSIEILNFQCRIATVKNKTEEILKDAQEKLLLLNENHDEIVGALKETRKELNEALDKVEEEMLRIAKMNKENEEAKLRAVSDKFVPSQKEILKLIKQMERIQDNDQGADTLALMRENENKLKTAETQLTDVKNDIKVKGHMFLPNTALQESLKKPDAMGKFFPNIWTEHSDNICIKTRSDICRCWVTSLTALPNNLVATDRGNSKVKVIDTTQLKVTSQLSLPSQPWAVTKVSDRKVAVTVPHIKKIMILKLESELLTEKEIGTNHKCHGISHWDGKFLVSFNKRDIVEIIDMSGSVLHTITTDMFKQKLFSFPEYVSISPNNKFLYVSNYLSNTVACIGLDGIIKGSYKDIELVQPRQTFVDENGIIYISGFGSQNIHLVSKDLKKIRVLSTGEERLVKPRAICLSKEGDKLFVDHSPNYISVFKVSSFLNAQTPKLNQK